MAPVAAPVAGWIPATGCRSKLRPWPWLIPGPGWAESRRFYPGPANRSGLRPDLPPDFRMDGHRAELIEKRPALFRFALVLLQQIQNQLLARRGLLFQITTK
jgi:hypothetical protein